MDDIEWDKGVCSGTGTYIIAERKSDGVLYRSGNTGSTWATITPAGAESFTVNDMKMSESGQYVVVVGTNVTTQANSCYTSADYGVTWTVRNPTTSFTLAWTTCDISDDGQIIMVGATGDLYVTFNGGVLWKKQNPPASNYWWENAGISGDGKIGVIVNTGTANEWFKNSGWNDLKTVTTTPFTSTGRSVIGAANAAAANTVLGLGTTDSPSFAGLTLTGMSGVVKATAGVIAGGGAHADLATVTANQHHNQAHVLNGADHTVSGLTTGHVLQATGATTFGFAVVPGLHDSVTLATSADVLLGLTGQALSLDTQAATYVLAGPVSGAVAAPTFRALALTDLPTITVGYGGTGVTTLTTAYGLLTAGTTPTGVMQTLAAGGTTQILVGGGASALPAWGADLPTAVTIGAKYIYRAEGTDIPITDGGTGLSTLTTAYGLLAAGTTATGTVQTLAAGATTQILVGGGASALPAWGTDLPTAVTIGSAYVYRAAGTDVPVTDGGTGLSIFAVGDIVHATAATTLAGLPDVAVGSYLRSGGVTTVPLWSTLILPNAATAYRLPVATSANTIGELAASGATGEYLAGSTGAIPSWATLNQAAVAGLTTASSPVFAGLTVDTNTLFVDPSTHFIGSGTLTPAFRFDVVGDVSNIARATFTNYGAVTGGSVNFRRANGTSSVPTKLLADQLTGGGFVWSGYYEGGSAGFGIIAGVGGYAEIDLTDVSCASYLRFDTTAVGATARREVGRMDSTGQLTMIGKIRANTFFNLNGTDGISDSTAGIPTAVTVSGGIVTAVTKTTYANTTFVPTVTLVGGAGNTVPVYTTNSGRYTRIANRCFVDISLSGDGGAEGAGTGQLTIALPVAASASFDTDYMPGGHFHNGVQENFAHVQIAGGASVLSLFIQTSATQTSAATGADQNSTTRMIRLAFNYEI